MVVGVLGRTALYEREINGSKNGTDNYSRSGCRRRGGGGGGGRGKKKSYRCVCMRSVICLENARVFQLWGFLVISCPRWRRSWKKRSLQERVGTVV